VHLLRGLVVVVDRQIEVLRSGDERACEGGGFGAPAKTELWRLSFENDSRGSGDPLLGEPVEGS